MKRWLLLLACLAACLPLLAQTKTARIGKGGTGRAAQSLPLPSIPGSLSPADVATGVALSVTLSWGVSTLETGGYDIGLSQSSTNIPTVAHVATGVTSWQPSTNGFTLVNNVTYYWLVCAIGTYGQRCTQTYSFTTVTGAPGIPVLVSPTDGSTGVSITPTIQWTAFNAATCNVDFGTSNPPSNVTTGQTCASYVPSTLSYLTTYYIKITAVNAGGSTSTAVLSFTTMAMGGGGGGSGAILDLSSVANFWDYVGSFRAPVCSPCGVNGSFILPQYGLAYSSDNTLFIPNAYSSVNANTAGTIARIGIPGTLGTGSTISAWPRATMVSAFMEPSEGIRGTTSSGVIQPEVSGTHADIMDLHVIGSDLWVSYAGFYDGNSSQAHSHIRRPKDLTSLGQVKGPYGLTFSGVQTPIRYTNGYMADVPSAWQTPVLGSVMVGTRWGNIAAGYSNGPNFMSWAPNVTNPSTSTQTVVPLVYYPPQNPVNYGGYSPCHNLASSPCPDPYPVPAVLQNQHTPLSIGRYSYTWGAQMAHIGVVWPEGSRSVLLFTVYGKGFDCYGNSQTTPPAQGSEGCYDPTQGTQRGITAYPYSLEVQAYDANDFLTTIGGGQPWAVQPTQHLDLAFPTGIGNALRPTSRGLAYDPATQRIYIEQNGVDTGGATVFHVYHLKGLTP